MIAAVTAAIFQHGRTTAKARDREAKRESSLADAHALGTMTIA
jgi:hypothetical protein